MKILIACEFSGIVRDAFREKGHDVTSCDITDTEKDGKHYKGDVRDILQWGWDMIIAHPPCTYLSAAGARWMYQGGAINIDRHSLAMKAKGFFEEIRRSNVKHIAIENPTPLKCIGLSAPTQIIQPYEFGEPYSKRTLLWLKNLPKLIPTSIVEHSPYLPSNTGGAKRGQSSNCVYRSKKDRSRTFQGIANAMAEQWGGLLL